MARILIMEMGIQPDYVLGYSLGEITASVISGVLTIKQALAFTVDFANLLHGEN